MEGPEIGPKMWQNFGSPQTDEIAFRISMMLNRVARGNKNRVFPHYSDLIYNKMAVNRKPTFIIPTVAKFLISSYIYVSHPDIKPSYKKLK